MILTTLVLSALYVLASLYAILSTRRLVKTTERRTQLRPAARHAVIRDLEGARQHPRGTMPQRDRIPVQVTPEVEAAHARVMEAYRSDTEPDDLLVRPFVAPAGAPSFTRDAPDTTTAVSAVP